MNEPQPNFGDYHRIVIGYHGTTRSVARKLVLQEVAWEPSKRSTDWLGHGIYFWEHAPLQAKMWAEQRKRKALTSKSVAERSRWKDDIAVVAAMIRLGNCLDLLEPANLQIMKGMYTQYQSWMNQHRMNLPRNVRSRKALDCAIFEHAYQLNLQDPDPRNHIDTARGVYVPMKGAKVWPGSWLVEGAHVQLCVLNHAISRSILGCWIV